MNKNVVSSTSKIGNMTKEELAILERNINDLREKENEEVLNDNLMKPKKKVKISKNQSGYINFYLILISTIFLSLLCILFSFILLGFDIS